MAVSVTMDAIAFDGIKKDKILGADFEPCSDTVEKALNLAIESRIGFGLAE